MKINRAYWSPNHAYAIGLLVADGSLSKTGRHIDFTSKDLELIKHLQICLQLSHCKIGKKNSGTQNTKKYYRIQFGDVQFYKWLVTIGISPNKSTTIQSVTVPDEYFFDFVRGVFDGDGTIYAYPDKRWRNSTTVTTGFASGSKPFLLWLQSNLNRHLDTTGFLTQGSRVLQLRYGRSDSVKIFHALYKDDQSLYLNRKFAKMKKILRIGGPQV